MDELCSPCPPSLHHEDMSRLPPPWRPREETSVYHRGGLDWGRGVITGHRHFFEISEVSRRRLWTSLRDVFLMMHFKKNVQIHKKSKTNPNVGDQMWTIHRDIFISEKRTLEHLCISVKSQFHSDIWILRQVHCPRCLADSAASFCPFPGANHRCFSNEERNCEFGKDTINIRRHRLQIECFFLSFSLNCGKVRRRLWKTISGSHQCIKKLMERRLSPAHLN